jgi:hypothetical protein
MQFGELSPAFYARTDTQAYAQGLRTLRNAYVMRTGGVQNRGGLVRKGNTKGNGVARLIPCEFSDEQNYVLEFTDERVRIWQNGELVQAVIFGAWLTATAYTAGLAVTNGGDTYYCYVAHTSGASTEPGVGADWEDNWTLANDGIEIPTPYQDTELDELVAVVIAPGPASGTLIIVHPSYAPRLLNQTSDTNQAWNISTATLGSTVPAPASLTASVGGTGGFIYAVTAVDADGNESTLSNTDETNNTSLSFATCTLTWSAVSGAVRYNVYRTTFGSFGLLGSSTTTTYVDDAPFGGSLTGPPIELSLFGSTDNYPSTAAIHQQRLLLGATNNERDRVWASVSGQPLNFAVSDPLVDSDSLNWRQISRRGVKVQHLLTIAERLISFNNIGEFIIAGGDSGILVPGEVNPQPLSFNGSSNLEPVPIDDTALYVQARGNQVRNLVPRNSDGYSGTDLSRTAQHMLNRYTIVAWAYQEIPHSIVWLVRNDGKMLSLTYDRESNVVAWATHDTDGEVESVCAVQEETEDAIYVVTKRVINAQTRRFVERLANRLELNPVLLDASVTVTASAVDAVSVDVSDGLVSGGGVSTATLFFGVGPSVCPAIGDQISMTYLGDTAVWTCTSTVGGFAFESADVDAQTLAGAAGFPTTITVSAANWAKVGNWSGVLVPYLQGEEVSAVVDDVVVASPNNDAYATITVNAAGVATMPDPIVTDVTVGLPYTTDIQTLDIDAVNTTVKERGLNIGGVIAWIEETGSFYAGPIVPTGDTLTGLERYTPQNDQGYDVTGPVTGVAEVTLQSTYNNSGRVLIRQVDPVPLTILSIAPTGFLNGGR